METKTKLIEKIQSVQDVSKDRNVIYEVMAKLGITFKKTNCRKCLGDYLNICREELGLIESAAAESDFNSKWAYKMLRPTSWNGKIISKDTDQETLSKFCLKHPDYCLKTTTEKNNNDMINIPDFIAEPNAVHEIYTDIAGVQFPAGIDGVQGTQGVQETQDTQGV